jgi:hypothetical protein
VEVGPLSGSSIWAVDVGLLTDAVQVGPTACEWTGSHMSD